MDNIVSIEEQSAPQLYHNNRFMAATVSGSCPGKSIMTELKQWKRLKLKYLMTPLQLI
jgi:HAE1 family hydrophobic/amphiphilic exporter-1/multidrug efflux pump